MDLVKERRIQGGRGKGGATSSKETHAGRPPPETMLTLTTSSSRVFGMEVLGGVLVVVDADVAKHARKRTS
uniref:Uncharacterized protein n=1 Tax=Oryza sativa subsp. japonica TaxID=39947 RepID=Q6ES03_ORYSJ|nr:hypothetical protein [Oryza sativa Japonica Group]BAD28567.1 hypothetical protein [Oryza sativa Japonica Group]